MTSRASSNILCIPLRNRYLKFNVSVLLNLFLRAFLRGPRTSSTNASAGKGLKGTPSEEVSRILPVELKWNKKYKCPTAFQHLCCELPICVHQSAKMFVTSWTRLVCVPEVSVTSRAFFSAFYWWEVNQYGCTRPRGAHIRSEKYDAQILIKTTTQSLQMQITGSRCHFVFGRTNMVASWGAQE